MRHVYSCFFAVLLIASSIFCFVKTTSLPSSAFLILEALTEDTTQEGSGGPLPDGWIKGFAWATVYFNVSYQAYPHPYSYGQLIYLANCCVSSNQHTACEIAAADPVCPLLTIH